MISQEKMFRIWFNTYFVEPYKDGDRLWKCAGPETDWRRFQAEKAGKNSRPSLPPSRASCSNVGDAMELVTRNGSASSSCSSSSSSSNSSHHGQKFSGMVRRLASGFSTFSFDGRGAHERTRLVFPPYKATSILNSFQCSRFDLLALNVLFLP